MISLKLDLSSNEHSNAKDLIIMDSLLKSI